MKKLLALLFLIPNFSFSEVIHVDLICEGESVLFCDNSKKCGVEPAVEIIKIAGNTLVHKIHGKHFLEVDKNTVSFKDFDTDGSIGFSLNINRKTGNIEIIRRWNKPYHFIGVCQQPQIKNPYDPT
ncbi:hypothetical protein N9O74_03795 [Methylophilaceae bacterium]|nr:hypothetical protein [Methylophilaceae bacterium]|tara:strand:+ start:25221 stop:25598 length:378 start_codon:yes stop_codon:yes gene_type:complete